MVYTCDTHIAMTLEDGEGFKKETMTQRIGEVLVEVLLRAQEEDRITYGLYDTAKVMESDPDNVLVCILPQNHLDNAALYINYMLLEAFCHENNIRILKVDCEEKLARLLEGSDNPVPHQKRRGLFSCILIAYPWESCGTAEDDLVQFWKESCDTYPEPVIELPAS